MIKFENITKKYNNKIVLNNLNFKIKKNEVVGFLGPNGAGKTTTMRILTTYLKPDFGKLTINDIDALRFPLEVKKIIGYLPESVPVYEDMLVCEFLTYRAKLKSLSGRQIKSQVNTVMEQCFITDKYKTLISNLSKGYTQRVGLADALLGKPDIVILDEPTSGLDPKQRSEVRKLINQLKKDRTIILSTHILSEIENVCEKVIIINKGNIIQQGEINEILFPQKNEYTVVLSGNKDRINCIFEKSSFFYDSEFIKEDFNGCKYKISFHEKKNIDEFISLIYRNDIKLRELKSNVNSLEKYFIEMTEKL